MTDWTAPLTLIGKHAKLVPLSHDHHDDLARVSRDGGLHKLWYTMIPDAAGMHAEIDRRLGRGRVHEIDLGQGLAQAVQVAVAVHEAGHERPARQIYRGGCRVLVRERVVAHRHDATPHDDHGTDHDDDPFDGVSQPRTPCWGSSSTRGTCSRTRGRSSRSCPWRDASRQ